MPARPAKPQKGRLPDSQTIRGLLLTWPIRQMRGVSVPRPPDGGSDPEWSWKYERQYGAPNLEDRKSVLRIAFNVLAANGKDVQPIVAALQQIKHRAFENARRGLTLDLQRQHVEEADVVRRNLLKWLARAVDLHRRANPDNLPNEHSRAWETRLTALTFDEPMTDDERALRDWLFDPRLLKAARRRKTPGNPDATLVKDAHDLLSDAGVPDEQHGHLLWAIGLVEEDGSLPRRNFPRR